MAMECSRGPEGSLGPSRLLELFEDLLLLFSGDKRSPPRSLLGDETVDAIQVEGSNDSSYRAVGQFDRLHCLFAGGADKKHDNDETSPIRFPVSGFSSRLEIGKRCVLGIGDEISLGHDP